MKTQTGVAPGLFKAHKPERATTADPKYVLGHVKMGPTSRGEAQGDAERRLVEHQRTWLPPGLLFERLHVHIHHRNSVNVSRGVQIDAFQLGG